MKRIVLACAVLVLGLISQANAAHRKEGERSIGKLRHFIEVLHGISEKIAAEHAEEEALYAEINQYCGTVDHVQTEATGSSVSTRSEPATQVESAAVVATDTSSPSSTAGDAASSDVSADARALQALRKSMEEASSDDADAPDDKAEPVAAVVPSTPAPAAAEVQPQVATEAAPVSTDQSAAQPAAPAQAAAAVDNEDGDDTPEHSALDDAEAAARQIAQEVGASVPSLEEAPPKRQVVQAKEQDTAVEKVASAAPAVKAQDAMKQAMADLAMDEPDSTPVAAAEPKTRTVEKHTEAAAKSSVSDAMGDLVSDAPDSSSGTVQQSPQADRSTEADADEKLEQIKQMKAMMDSADAGKSTATAASQQQAVKTAPAAVQPKTAHREDVRAMLAHRKPVRKKVKKSTLKETDRQVMHDMQDAESELNKMHAELVSNEKTTSVDKPAAVESKQAKVAKVTSRKSVPTKKSAQAVKMVSRKNTHHSTGSHTKHPQMPKPIHQKKQPSPQAKMPQDNDEALELDAEQELSKMNAVLSSNDDAAPAVAPAVHSARVSATAKAAPAAKHASPPHHKKAASTKMQRVHVSAKGLKDKGKNVAQKPPAVPKVVARFPVTHSLAASSSKRTTAKSAVSASASKKKKSDSEELKVGIDVSQDLAQMSDLLNFVPANEVAPSVLAAEDVQLPKPPVKAANRPDSVLEESDALERVIDDEEAKLSSVATERRTGSEAQLKRQLRAYVASGGDSVDNIVPEKVDDTGFVSFDPQIVAAVSLPSVTLGIDDANATKAKPAQEPTQAVKPAAKKAAVKAATPSASAKAAAGASTAASKPVAMAATKQSVVVADRQGDDASIASQSAALDDLAGAIPNIEKEALQMFNSYGGEPSSLENVGIGAPPPTFLQFTKRRVRHTPGLPTQAEFDAAWNSLRLVAEQTQGAVKYARLSLKHRSSLIQEQSFAKHEIAEQCDWLISNYHHRQKVRAHEMKMLQEGNELIRKLKTQLHHSSEGRLRGR